LVFLQIYEKNKKQARMLGLALLEYFYVSFKIVPNGKAFAKGGIDSTVAPQSTKVNKKHKSSI
jgi:hypothetical protein